MVAGSLSMVIYMFISPGKSAGIGPALADHVIGMIFYAKLVGSKSAELSQYTAIVFAAIPIIVAIGSRIFFAESMSVSKTAGLFLAAISIWLLSK